VRSSSRSRIQREAKCRRDALGVGSIPPSSTMTVLLEPVTPRASSSRSVEVRPSAKTPSWKATPLTAMGGLLRW